MLHTRPDFKREKSNIQEEIFKLVNVKGCTVTVKTNYGTQERVDSVDFDRLFYILDGEGTVRFGGMNNRYREARGNALIEVPAHTTVEMYGQFKYVCLNLQQS